MGYDRITGNDRWWSCPSSGHVTCATCGELHGVQFMGVTPVFKSCACERAQIREADEARRASKPTSKGEV